jgi:hypothetical protein
LVLAVLALLLLTLEGRRVLTLSSARYLPLVVVVVGCQALFWQVRVVVLGVVVVLMQAPLVQVVLGRRFKVKMVGTLLR